MQWTSIKLQFTFPPSKVLEDDLQYFAKQSNKTKTKTKRNKNLLTKFTENWVTKKLTNFHYCGSFYFRKNSLIQWKSGTEIL
jgi:hypothetical protein